MDKHLIQGIEILLVASCCGNWDKPWWYFTNFFNKTCSQATIYNFCFLLLFYILPVMLKVLNFLYKIFPVLWQSHLIHTVIYTSGICLTSLLGCCLVSKFCMYVIITDKSQGPSVCFLRTCSCKILTRAMTLKEQHGGR